MIVVPNQEVPNSVVIIDDITKNLVNVVTFLGVPCVMNQ